MAGKLTNYGVQPGHFKTVFVDESGHAWEPEVLGCFSHLLVNDGTSQLVLAGDPKQLGPVVASDVAKAAGLGLSMLERLMEGPLYANNVVQYPHSLGYNPLCITKLVRCYRCHPDILYVPNQLFYDGHLVSSASDAVARSMLSWRMLPNPDSPLLFHGVAGDDIREASSPSWFNVAEIELVIEYVNQLIGMMRVNPAEIGIITPYSKQVQKIKVALGSRRIANVTVGSCEQFQGQERKVVIISTVRSTKGYQGIDEKFKLGFVDNPKRFNVAVTRAQALLIIVGNPRILVKDRNWREMLLFCRQRNACVGLPVPFDDPNDNDDGGGFGANPFGEFAVAADGEPDGIDVEDEGYYHAAREFG